MKSSSVLFSLLFFPVFFFSSIADNRFSDHDDWTLVKNKNDIKIYMYKESNAFASIRTHAKVKATIQDFIDYSHNVESYPEWIYACSEAVPLKAEGNNLVYYTITDMPFPFTDRILTLDSYHEIHPEYYRAYSNAIPSPKIEGDYVEIPHFNSHWKVRQIDPKTIIIDYSVETEPGGYIPPWLYNLGVDVGPYKTMLALKEKLEAL
jgi:hypothetical protein